MELPEHISIDLIKKGYDKLTLSAAALGRITHNRAYLDNYRWQKDVWHIPEFFPLLTQQQEQLDKAITGQISAKEALDTVAAFQDKTLREAGRIK